MIIYIHTFRIDISRERRSPCATLAWVVAAFGCLGTVPSCVTMQVRLQIGRFYALKPRTWWFYRQRCRHTVIQKMPWDRLPLAWKGRPITCAPKVVWLTQHPPKMRRLLLMYLPRSSWWPLLFNGLKQQGAVYSCCIFRLSDLLAETPARS